MPRINFHYLGLSALLLAPLSAFASGSSSCEGPDCLTPKTEATQTSTCNGASCGQHYQSCSQGYCEQGTDSGCGSWETTKNFGANALSGSTSTGAQLAGLSAYMRFHWSHLGVEASINSSTIVDDRRVAGRFSGASALMLYLNSDGAVRGYGVWGRGATSLVFGDSSTRARTKQIGGGVEIDISEKFALSADLRRLQDEEKGGDINAARALSLPTEFTVGALGLNLKF